MKARAAGLPPTGDVEIQDPVDVVSKEIEVSSRVLPDLGLLKLGFEVSATPEPKAAEVRKQFGTRCGTDRGTSIECTVFHYSIRNLGDRPVRNGRMTCSDFSIIPEYRMNNEEWKQLRSRLMACSANVFIETPILPGHAAEGNFTLGSLAPRFDTSPLYPAEKFQIRFHFHSNACFASPDGSFCIKSIKEQITVISNVVTIDATASAANGSTNNIEPR
jgi:hypothetical protein